MTTPRSIAATPRAGASNIAPQPSPWRACAEQGVDSVSCVGLAREAIDNARALEHLPALVLPDNFQSLRSAEQTFVLIDLERVDRGLRPLVGLAAAFDDAARPAARRQVEPTPEIALLQRFGVHRYLTLWASTFGPLASDYEWMYDDGYSAAGNSNVDCRSPEAAGCWAHRRAILKRFHGDRLLLAGAGSATVPQGFESITVILTGGTGASPRFSYTWREALAHGADGQPPRR